MSRVGCPYGCVCACVCWPDSVRVWKNIYHGPKQESSQGVLNGPACLEKPFSKWMPLSIRVSDRNLPRAMPAGNKIASLCAPFLFMRSLFSKTKKNVKCVQIIFEFVLHGKRQGSKLNIMWSVQFLSVEILFFLTSEVAGERDRKAETGQHKNSWICLDLVNLRNNTEMYTVLMCFTSCMQASPKINKLFKCLKSHSNIFCQGLVKMLFFPGGMKGR